MTTQIRIENKLNVSLGSITVCILYEFVEATIHSKKKLKHDPNQWAKGEVSIKVRLLFWSSTETNFARGKIMMITWIQQQQQQHA